MLLDTMYTFQQNRYVLSYICVYGWINNVLPKDKNE